MLISSFHINDLNIIAIHIKNDSKLANPNSVEMPAPLDFLHAVGANARGTDVTHDAS